MNDERLMIVVAQAAWIFVGLVRREGSEVVIREARNIRQWGTTDGLGQLALHGPTKDTVLDDYGIVRVPAMGGVVLYVDCDASAKAWKKLYKVAL